MRNVLYVCRRELGGYFTTPVAYVFIVVFLVVSGALTFFLGNFFQRGQADLQAFFMWHPWMYLFLVPAISMRLWAEERKQGTMELLLTLPISMPEAVIGKFLAAWLFTGVALALTFPLWITVSYLGTPDHAVVVLSYLGSFLMAGGFLAIGACISALTKNQVIAFVLACALCFGFTVSGSQIVLGFFSDWAPRGLIDMIASFSFLTHFQAIIRGVLDLRDAVFFISVIVLFLFINSLLIDYKKAS